MVLGSKGSIFLEPPFHPISSQFLTSQTDIFWTHSAQEGSSMTAACCGLGGLALRRDAWRIGIHHPGQKCLILLSLLVFPWSDPGFGRGCFTSPVKVVTKRRNHHIMSKKTWQKIQKFSLYTIDFVAWSGATIQKGSLDSLASSGPKRESQASVQPKYFLNIFFMWFPNSRDTFMFFPIRKS